jgi:rSAM/selenodomain-associated transferase 2
LRTFIIICTLWTTDMALLAAIGPIGRAVPASMLLYACGFLLLAAAVRHFPAQLKPAPAYGLILLLGIAARILFIAYPPNTDIFRYIWEGAIQLSGFNPYLTPPDHPSLSALAQGELNPIWRQLNHKGATAIYPPASMLLFRGLAAIGPTPLVFKSAFTLLDIGVMAVLCAILRLRGLPPARLLLYAGNPLAIVFICGEGHVDALQVFFLCCACWFLLTKRCALAGLSLGLGAMAKYLVLTAVPFLWNGCRRSGFAAVLLPVALYAFYHAAGIGLFASIARFTTDMQYNAFLADGLGRALPAGWVVAAGVALLLCGLWVWLTEDDPLHAVYLALGCLLLLLPTLHPWYLALIAPFLCLFPSGAWLYLQAAMLFTFPVLGHEFRTGGFQEIAWAVWPEYLPFFALAALGFFRSNRLPLPPAYGPVSTLSVVIPTLNEGGTIRRCLDEVRSAGRVQEVIVSDGGSTDGTVETAREAGAMVVAAGKGRGVQLRAGAEKATGDIILFLHADSVLDPGAGDRIIHRMATDREAAGGCLGMRFERGGRVKRGIAALNNFRASATGIGFGDQAQFVRREALDRIGGVPELMLMEDVELSLRLKRVGRPVFLRRGVTVSGRHWQANGALPRLCLILRLFARFLLERRLFGISDAAEGYYRRYYSME